MSEEQRPASGNWLVGALAVIAVLALGVAGWQSHRFAKLQSAAAQLAGEMEAVRNRAAQVERDQGSPGATAGSPPPAEKRAPAPAERKGAEPSDGEPDRAHLAIQLRESLKVANATIAELEMRVGTLEEKLKKAGDENQRLSAEEQELRERVDSTVRLVGAVQAELKSRNERLLQLELSNKNLRETSAAAIERSTRTVQALRDVEEIDRRRENYLNNILRRFRELTEQYRTISLRLDSPRDNAAAVPGELSRIQNTVGMAEEDLKQISSLNAQASRALAKAGR